MTTRTKRRYWRAWPSVKINARGLSNDYKSHVARWAAENNIAFKIRTSSTVEEIEIEDVNFGKCPGQVYNTYYDVYVKDPNDMLLFMLAWGR